MVYPHICLHVQLSSLFLLGVGNECGHVLLVVHVQIITRRWSWAGLDLYLFPGCFLWFVTRSACSGFAESTWSPRAVMCSVECGAARSHSVLSSCWRSWFGGLCRGAQYISWLSAVLWFSGSFVMDAGLGRHGRHGRLCRHGRSCVRSCVPDFWLVCLIVSGLS